MQEQKFSFGTEEQKLWECRHQKLPPEHEELIETWTQEREAVHGAMTPEQRKHYSEVLRYLYHLTCIYDL